MEGTFLVITRITAVAVEAVGEMQVIGLVDPGWTADCEGWSLGWP